MTIIIPLNLLRISPLNARKTPPRATEQPGLNVFRHPGIHAMGNDVIERRLAEIMIGDRRRDQIDIRQPQPPGPLSGPGDLVFRQINAGEAGFREPGRQRQQIAARGTADLQHFCLFETGGGKTENPRDGVQMRRR